jgi:hypothetical protein
MENIPNEYDAGTDQNQGIVGTMARNEQHGDTDAEGTQLPEFDPNLATQEGETDPENTDPADIGEQKFVNDEGQM